VSKSAAVWELLQNNRLIALLNPKNPEECLRAYETLAPLGVVLEVALRGDAAIPSLEFVLKAHPDALILAGTVLTREQARDVIDVGAAGVVSADYISAVVEECVAGDILCVPGGLSDAGKQLVQKAELYDVTLDRLKEEKPWQWVYKVFPAMVNPESTLATAKAWRAIYHGLQLVYTGGVTLENVGGMARQDPDGIFCGSALTRHADDSDLMREEARRWLAEIQANRVAVKPGLEKKEAGDAHLVRGESQSAPSSDVVGTADAKRVVTFGEIMLRLSPRAGQRLRQARSLEVTYGGAEANVAVALAQWDVESRFVTVLPAHDIGQAAVDLLRSLGVDTSFIRRDGHRIGTYFLEQGASQRPSRVLYDRSDSAIAGVGTGDIDWENVFDGAVWFHWTGITPALSEGAAAVTAEAVRAAKATGLSVSTDLNYRAKLWSRERAKEVMDPLMEYVDVVVANEEDAANVFGIVARGSHPELGEIDAAAYEDVARQLVERFDLQVAAITLRESHSASDNTWSACLWDGEDFLISRSYPIHIVDRVGGGDAFSAGLVFGLLTGKGSQDALEFGVAASCLKQTIVGDFNLVSVSEVEALAGGNVAGRIKR
jgi:2-dehydro-3-deoxygluconokinase